MYLLICMYARLYICISTYICVHVNGLSCIPLPVYVWVIIQISGVAWLTNIIFQYFSAFFFFVYLKNIPMEQTNGKTTNVFVIAKCALDIVVVYCCFCWCAPVKNQLVNKWDSRLSYKWGDIDTDTPSKYTIAIPLIHMRMRDHRLPGAPRVRLSALLLEFCLSVYVCVLVCLSFCLCAL